VISEEDIEKLASAARELAPSASVYLEEDFIMNLLETVLDYMLQTEVVVKALERFRKDRWNEVRTLDDLDQLMARFPQDRAGNTALAQYLWGYNLWTRAQQLRELARFFRSSVLDQEQLKQWAHGSSFKTDFEGRVKGLGPAVYQWLVMRQGVDTVKPDVHVRRFAEAAVGRALTDRDVIELATLTAASIGIKAFELDWRIWEASRGGALPYPDQPT
jgi:tRNA U55 pseudouridine synthase TruB